MSRPSTFYHLTTLGMVLLLVSVTLLVSAALGLLAGEAFNSREPATAPGRGVVPIPAPQYPPAR